MNFTSQHKKKTFLALFVITLLSLLAYTILIPFLGFYSDDFFYAYVGHFYGSRGLIESLNIDRPLDGHLLSFYYSIIGSNLLYWHIFVFFLRLLGGYALFFTLRKLWPNNLSSIASITLLFLIYPGFLQQVGPIGYQNVLTALLSWLFSFFFTIYAIKSTGKIKAAFFIFFSIIFQLASFFLVEYFIGMEIFRLLFIFYIVKDNENFSSIKSFLTITMRKVFYWSPYILGLLLFVMWRIFLFKSVREVTDLGWVTKMYYSNPLWLLKIPLEVLYSFISVTAFAYFLPITIRLIRIPVEQSILSIVIGAISGCIFYLLGKNDSMQTPKANNFGKNLLVIGIISSIGTLLPIIISGRNIRLAYNYDRYTVTSILSVIFIIIGLLTFNILAKRRRLIISLLITLSIITHLTNGFLASANWNQQKDIWWQLYWRSPNIKDNAMLVVDFPPLTRKSFFNDINNKIKWYRIYWVDYQIWTTGNLFFNYNRPAKTHFNGDYLLDKNIIEKIKNKTVEDYRYYNTSIAFTRDFGNSVIISTPSDNSCLWVFDKNIEEFPNGANPQLRSVISYSDADKLIGKDGSTPPLVIFGNEPPHTWCYYFQKASLARQSKDWNQLSQLTEEVFKKNLTPKDPNEWFPFIEGLLIKKDYLAVENLIKLYIKEETSSNTFSTNLCKMFKRLQTQGLENIYCKSS